MNYFVQEKFIWDRKHDLLIRKIYDHRIARRLQQMMQDVHEGRDYLTIWLCSDIKKELDVYFSTDEGFKRCRLTNKTNRASLRSSKYTGGSVTFMKTKSRLSKSLECEVTLVETFKYTHTLKANKERFTDERSVTHYEDYTQRLEAATQQSQPSGDDSDSDALVVDPDRVWRKTTSEPTRIASMVLVVLRQHPADPEEVVNLWEEVLKLMQELHQQAQQSEKRYNELLTYVGDTVAIWAELTVSLERL
ncbi:hypothetical protein Ahy_B01g055823 [Arachis hypogaea]|uniref:Uncharacterized protein n=1 Tax=Arachis hypogaea TaxID=3818 RepID=A0A445AXD8_ARAHY|nr:hypothetical protein Ahy_B01g055823 [Arachis hypogaea]